MKGKKILSAGLAGICAISAMSISALAADDTQNMTAGGSQTFSVDAGFTAPVIDVTLPSALNAVINPYKIAIKVTSPAGTELTTGTTGIDSPEYTITNNSDEMGVKVKAKIAAKGLELAADAEKAQASKDKVAFAQLTCQSPQIADPVVLTFTDTLPDNATPVMQMSTGEEGKFQISGAVPEEPEIAWSDTDKLTMQIVFDINPYNPAAGGDTPAASNLTYSGKGTFAGTGNSYTLTVSEGTDAPGTTALTFTPPTGKTIQSIAKQNPSDRAVTVSGTTVTFANPRSGDSDTLTITYDDSSTATVTITVNA